MITSRKSIEGGRTRRRSTSPAGGPWGRGALLALLATVAAPGAPAVDATSDGERALARAAGLAAQERIDERHPLRGDGRLDVHATAHSIRVEAWDREEVRVTGTLDPDRERLEATGDDRALALRVVRDGRGGGTSPARSLEIRVPTGARLSVGTVSGAVEVEGVSGSARVSSTSGAIRLRGDPASAALHTVSGTIEVEGAVPDLELNSVSGSLRARGVGGRLEAHTVSGAVEVAAERPLDRFRAHTVSGRVEVAGALSPQGTVTVESHSGPVTLRLPPDTPAEYEVSSFTGSIENRITDQEPRTLRWGRHALLTVGAGSARVRIETFSGRIALEPLP